MKRDESLVVKGKKVTKKKKVTAVLAVPKSPKEVRKQPVKKVEIKSLKKTALKKDKAVSLPGVIISPQKKADPELVLLPHVAPLRLVEKVHLYQMWYKQNSPAYAAKVAKISGYTLILLGTLLAVSSYIKNWPTVGEPAATVCAVNSCVEIDDKNLAPTVPLVQFLNSTPDTLTTDTDITLRATVGTKPRLLLKNVSAGTSLSLSPIAETEDSEFKYLIETSKLQTGYYELTTIVSDEKAEYIYKGPTFSINNPEELAVAIRPQAETERDELATSTATSSEIVNDEEVTVFEKVSALKPISLEVLESNQSIFAKIDVGVHVPADVLIYAKDSTTNNLLYLGSASLIQNQWFFNLSALDLPTHNLLVYAEFTSQGRLYKTSAVSYMAAVVSQTKLTRPNDIKILVDKINLSLLTAEVNNQTRLSYLSHIASSTSDVFNHSDETNIADAALLNTADTIIRDNTEFINNILFNYAMTVQGRSEFLESLARSHSLSQMEQLVRAYTNESESDMLLTVVNYRLTALLNLVREFEQGVGQDTNDLTSNDTDTDGLSDFDELANTLSDPAQSDSDNDGTLDGIELVLGSDPLNPTEEISKEAKLTSVLSSILSIKKVARQALVVNGKTTYYPIVIGVGLPNSFVFVNIEGNKEVGIIKTSADGTFNYTFEQELKDNKYDIALEYRTQAGLVAITSATYSFASNVDNLLATVMFAGAEFSDDLKTSNVPYVAAAAVAVVAFGFVLLLLAESLRSKKKLVLHAKV